MLRSFPLPTLLATSLVFAACQSKPATGEQSSAKEATAQSDAIEAPAAPSSPRTAGSPKAAPSAATDTVPDATPPKDAVKTKSGVAMVVLKPGTGAKKPKPTDTVRVNLAGYSQGQKIFATPEPQVMPVAEMAPGWQEGVTEMVEGEKRRLCLRKWPTANHPCPPAQTNLILALELGQFPNRRRCPRI